MEKIDVTAFKCKITYTGLRHGKFSKKIQIALATVQNVQLTHGICQNLPETCAFLMAPC